MDAVWIALLSGAVGALIASGAAFGTQLYLTRRAERQRADEQRLSTLLDFTGRADAAVIWAAHVHSHAAAASSAKAVPSIVLRRLQPFDLKDLATSYGAHVTALIRDGGRLMATEGASVQAPVRDVVDFTLKLLVCYLSPVETRPKYQRWFAPLAPIDKSKVEHLRLGLNDACHRLEVQVLANCRTLEGSQLRELTHSPAGPGHSAVAPR